MNDNGFKFFFINDFFSLFGTPLILLVACFICFMTARIIEVFGVQKIANIFVSIGTMDLAIFIVYVFGRYSGNYPSLVTIIDQFSEQLWLFVSYIFFYDSFFYLQLTIVI